ncbi:MAG: alkaline phosphatase [Candidatus Marinimicrobia bacterium]|nr:alkaline phosphatase [Candidatus Neomarinimicrobiota bacterium]MDD5581628.1 alkaline phosphatase [Candidatus Neomarinimicrobiota bacterium]
MRKKRISLIVIPIIFVFLFVLLFITRNTVNKQPRNIILMIGDGMGISQITTGRIYRHPMHMERFNIMGLATTYSKKQFITDSAAGATALSTGYKVENGVIAMSLDGERYPTIAERAKELGKSAGVVATTGITHATPAAFISHVESRNMQDVIAEQIANNTWDVLFGSGWGYFVPQHVEGSLRNDDKNPLEILQQKMQVALTPEEFKNLANIPAAALLHRTNNFPKASDNFEITLEMMTHKALKILSKNNKGFFLMVEGSQIDWGGHENDMIYIRDEMLAFDDAVGVVLDFAEKDKNTLVIITADHETGGMSLLSGDFENHELIGYHFATKGHTATMVPVFSYGPYAERFGGIQDNTDIGKMMLSLWK